MRTTHLLLAGSATLLALAGAPAQAASSAASSASDSASTSVGSVSDSVKKSSNSSSKDKNASAGQYTVTDMVAVADQPGMVQLTLAAVPGTGADGPLALVLPLQAVQQGRVATGGVVTAVARPYGVEFTSAATNAAFFLVLADAWYQELSSRPVVL